MIVDGPCSFSCLYALYWSVLQLCQKSELKSTLAAKYGSNLPEIEKWRIVSLIFLETGLFASLLQYLYTVPMQLLVPFRTLIYCVCPSVLWRCWLGGRKGIRPVENWMVGCWRGYLFAARCRLAYGPAAATATHCLLLQQNPDWF